MLQFPLQTNSCKNFTRAKIFVCKTSNIKLTKFSPDVNEFPSHCLGKEPGFSLLCFTGFHGRAVSARAAFLQELQLEKLQRIFQTKAVTWWSYWPGQSPRNFSPGWALPLSLDWSALLLSFHLLYLYQVFEKYQVSDDLFGQSSAAVTRIISSFYCHCSTIGGH